MFRWKYFYFILYIHSSITVLHINLYYTDEIIGNYHILPRSCLYINPQNSAEEHYETIQFCLSRLTSSYQIEKQQSISKSTFDELAKQNITSEQLYFWSASIDLIERYQFYLNQLSNQTGDLSSANDEYYNCTLPQFGPQCQYVLIHDILSYSSFDKSLEDYYSHVDSAIFSLTCYTHLKCNRTASFLCLDWRDICDGEIDCLDDGIDENYCWELEVNECKENEYRRRNGLCIPKSFVSSMEPSWIDWSDVPTSRVLNMFGVCYSSYWPSFSCEDSSIANYEQLRFRDIKQNDLSMQLKYSKKDPSVSDNCSLAFQCLLEVVKEECLKNIQNFCPQIVYFPYAPVVFTDIYFIYKIENLTKWLNMSAPPFYICYNQTLYDPYFNDYSNIIINNMKCVDSESQILKRYSTKKKHEYIIDHLRSILRKYHLNFNYTSYMCNRSNMYQCMNSIKCISTYRLMDDNLDCPYGDDENANITSTVEYLHRSHFNCHNGIYIFRSLIQDGICQCGYSPDLLWCPDEDYHITFLKTNIVFQHICDGFVDMIFTPVDGRHENDETDCQQWQCDNIYTHCNGILNCPNGIDEAYCDRSNLSDCPTNWHQCVSPLTNELFCLPIEQLGDEIIDCLGATDEISLCMEASQGTSIGTYVIVGFYCTNFSLPICINPSRLCNDYNECDNNDDERFCTNLKSKQFLRYFKPPSRLWHVIDFQLHETIQSNIENSFISDSYLTQQPIVQTRLRYCHRGLDIDLWLDKQNNLSTNACFCPPSYFGDRCQYQSQRVSLTIKFQALAGSWQIPFAIIISLIDDTDQRLIHSYEQITYLSSRDCDRRFYKYLVYSTQPKESNKTYSIHIDFYEKISLNYRGSVLLPIVFSFLPVNRISFIVNIPRIFEDRIESCFIDRCDHGRCMKYTNQPHHITFCRCYSGWTGRYCHIRHDCHCSSDSLCIGISSDNRSICVCPLHKFGPRCLLTDTICQKQSNASCLNGGQCIPNHQYMIFFQNFSCICPKNFTGDRCEIANSQLTITFSTDIALPQSLLFHFIEITKWSSTDRFTSRATTYRSIPFRQDSITIYWSEPFHLVFIELSHKNYYLTHIQKNYTRAINISRTLASSDRCPNITELFNKTFLQWPLIRRIKYYHLPCQNHSLNLSCFHDETHLCLCYDFHQRRTANCFPFDHHMEFDCSGQNECQQDARCLQNKVDCPTKSLCICPSCYYGQLCQFSTSGIHSSLDGILGYHILPNVRFMNQSSIVKTSFAMAIIFIIMGLIDVIFSLSTFKNKAVREYACGLYLLFSSITTFLTITLFELKYFILLLSQMNILLNETFFLVQCHTLDFLLQVCLSMDQWLNACVAIERTLMIIQGTNFNRNRSVKAVKFVIMILLIITGTSYVPDPIYRHVIEEENDFDDIKRTWCIVRYSASIRIYNYVIHIFHIIGPFLINLISVIILFKVKAQQQSILHPNKSYKQLLIEQFQELKHLIIAPIILVLLTLPRLAIIFLSKCMESSDDVWLYLMGYFVSFIPSILTSIIFILPSKFYKLEFKNSVQRYRKSIQRSLRPILNE